MFDSFFKQMVAIGENSGKIEKMLNYCAHHYEQEIGETCNRIAAYMQPALLAIAAGLVGWIICALYLPILQLGLVL